MTPQHGNVDATAVSVHNQALVIDIHSDVHLDLVRSRAAGQTRVFERRHLKKWIAGGVNGIVLNTIPKFGPEPYPYRTSPVDNLLIRTADQRSRIARWQNQLQMIH